METFSTTDIAQVVSSIEFRERLSAWYLTMDGEGTRRRRTTIALLRRKIKKLGTKAFLFLYSSLKIVEFLETILHKLRSCYQDQVPGLFICGDFNFHVEKGEFKQRFLDKHNVKLYPTTVNRLPSGHRSGELDYILTRGNKVKVLSCYEFEGVGKDTGLGSDLTAKLPEGMVKVETHASAIPQPGDRSDTGDITKIVSHVEKEDSSFGLIVILETAYWQDLRTRRKYCSASLFSTTILSICMQALAPL
jgi:hypothetical protein